jgi:predicted ATP-grasp superfamily ATP-dependent carboligase
MHHFLLEFITGGGLSDQALSESLINEGELMVQTLVNELSQIEGAEISLCRDSRLELLKNNSLKQHTVENNLDDILPECIKKSDVCWLIAPETEGCLEKYAKLFMKSGSFFIGSTPEAIKLATSKYLTNKVLVDNKINVVKTMWLKGEFPESKTGWIVKPNDGVGAENSFLVTDKNKLSELQKNEIADNLIVQPYLHGQHMSMSLLVFNNDVQLLACNQQHIDINENGISLKAIGVNECLSFKDDMLEIAKKIISAIPGLAGYIGVDLIEVNRVLYVLEVNPRFTTAYAGISESTGFNVTDKILNTFLNKILPDVQLDSAVPVRINI